MKYVKSTGFVPLLDVQRGGIAGYPVVKARELLLLGDTKWQEVDIPDTIETVEVDGPEVSIEASPVDDDNLIEVPEDWQGMHAMKRLALAKQISKANGEEFSAPSNREEKDAYASKIISDELDRRNGVVTTEERRIIPPAERTEGGDQVVITTVSTPVPNIPGQPEIFNPAGTPAEPVIDPVTGQPVADNTHGTGAAPFTGEDGAEDLEKAKNIAAAGTVEPQNGQTDEEIAAGAAATASGESTDGDANADGANGDDDAGNSTDAGAGGDADKVPEIPENWKTLHHNTRLKLAKDIFGDLTVSDGQTQTEAADAAIEAEVQRRAAAKQGGSAE